MSNNNTTAIDNNNTFIDNTLAGVLREEFSFILDELAHSKGLDGVDLPWEDILNDAFVVYLENKREVFWTPHLIDFKNLAVRTAFLDWLALEREDEIFREVENFETLLEETPSTWASPEVLAEFQMLKRWRCETSRWFTEGVALAWAGYTRLEASIYHERMVEPGWWEIWLEKVEGRERTWL